MICFPSGSAPRPLAEAPVAVASTQGIARLLSRNGPGLAGTPGGRRLLYVQTDRTESDMLLVENFS